MQQLQSLYRGDSSPSLSQIFGMQYQPQQAISQAANTAVSSGMAAGAQVKTTAMNNATQMAIANANRFENQRQFNMTNKLANRNADETQRHNMSVEGNADKVTAWNTGGSMDAEDQKAQGAIKAQITEMEMSLGLLDKNDPKYAEKAAEIQNRIKALRDGAANAMKTRGGLTAFSTHTASMYGGGTGRKSFTTSIGDILTGIGGRKDPAPGAAPKPQSFNYNSVQPDHVYTDSSGTHLPAGTDLKGYNISPVNKEGIDNRMSATTISPTLSQTLGTNMGVQTLGGQPINGQISVGGGSASPAAVPAPAPAVEVKPVPAAVPAPKTNWWDANATFKPAPGGGAVVPTTQQYKLPSWFNPAGV